jgi:hypothetical protein
MKRIIDKTTNLFLRDDLTFDEETEIALDVKPASGLYKPKWDSENLTWIEGLTDEELATLQEEQAKAKAKQEAIQYLSNTNYVSNNYNDLLKIDSEKAEKYYNSVSDTYGITVEEILEKRASYIEYLNDF